MKSLFGSMKTNASSSRVRALWVKRARHDGADEGGSGDDA
jgi:hypothetical protein